MAPPERRTTGCWLLWLRADLPRERARDYWRGPHGRYVARIPGVEEYRQHHFSAEDHGFWPAPAEVGTTVPPDWRIDGMPEVTYAGVLPPLSALPTAVKTVWPDEANFIDRVLCHLTAPGGGRWFDGGHDDEASARAVVLLRRRPGVGRRRFASFLHDVLAATLARDRRTLELRTHAFVPYLSLMWPTPGVAHDNPPNRRYHGAIVLGADDRSALEDLLASPELTATHQAQADHCVAIHAYAVDETVTVVRHGEAQTPP